MLVVFLITTIISQIYIHFYNPLRLEAAMMYSVTDSIPFKGVSIRNEQLKQYNGTGIIAYLQEDGSKLAKNSVVAQSYSNRRDISIQKQIDEIAVKIELLKQAEALENTDNSQLESFNNQINIKHSETMEQINSDNYSRIYSLKNDYLTLLCKKMIIRNTVVNYNEKIAALEQEAASLEMQKSASAKDILIDESGYFVSVVDGYENKLNFDTAANLTKAEIENIIKNPVLEVSDKVIGKIIDDYKWQFAAVLDTETTRALFTGATVNVRIGSSSQAVAVTIKSIERLLDGSSIFIFECDRFTSDYVGKRVLQYNLMLDNYSGIRISSNAVRFNEEGETGVFIQNGAKIEFKKIKIIRTEKDYIIAEDTGESGYISLYDNVIVSGTNLYEGKIVG